MEEQMFDSPSELLLKTNRNMQVYVRENLELCDAFTKDFVSVNYGACWVPEHSVFIKGTQIMK